MKEKMRTEEIILQHLGEPKTIFVFPTGLSATAWAEKMLIHVAAVAMERFIAWDSFKSEAIRSRHQNKASIPSLMRKIFASHLIQENARAVAAQEQPLFENLINPQFAQEAQSFTNWIASLLPSLETWRKNHQAAGLELDAQDRDLQKLHQRYQEFLEEHDRFDPAWEQPPFHDDGNHYIIFYPEILTDFSEYQHILESSSHITLVKTKTTSKNLPQCIFYSNARQELRETALFIRNLVEEKGLPYSDIFVSVPDMESMAPYLQREFQLYAIPAVFRSGKTLSAYGAGAIFAQIKNCLSSDFSFESLNNLLQNHHLPWKEAELNQQLIAFGIENNCLCSYKEGNVTVDVWQEAFKKKPQEERLKNMYETLRREVKRFTAATSFEKLREAYFQFRDKFWDMSQASSECDLILGRCITELAGLMDLEQEFPQIQVPDPFGFFLQVLEEKEYLAQTRQRGVSVVPYRLVAAAPAGCHIVVGASQTDITLVFQQLGFLSQLKRNRLGLTDVNPSDAFISLYQEHSSHPVRFTAAEKSFSGYAIPHNGLVAVKREQLPLQDSVEQSLSKQDFLTGEAEIFQAARQGQQQQHFVPTSIQQEGFHYWQQRVQSADDVNSADFQFPHWKENITAKLPPKAPHGSGQGNKPLQISQTHLNDFFSCPRKWYFNRILSLKEPDTQAQLMRDAWMGTIYHEIIHQYLEPLQRCGSGLAPLETDQFKGEYLLPEEELRLEEVVHKVLANQQKLSPLTQELLLAQKASIIATAKEFVMSLCRQFPHYQVVALEEKITCQPKQLHNLLERLWEKGHIPPICKDFPSTAAERQDLYHQLQDFVLTGQLDCLLNSPEDSLVLLDFKLGNSPKATECTVDEQGKLTNFQMAFYCLLYEAQYPERSIESAAFMTINDGELNKIFGFESAKLPQREILVSTKSKDILPYNYTVAATLQYVTDFAQAITTSTFPQLAQVSYDTCKECAWKRICRTTYTVGGEKV
ncbi:MAG: PD-(D/E)XK nuclease family protein [Treponema sp.]|nr:PD-(D/E)XK nuclease family protein [Treponema sp.]